jgi:hypothetical protein
MGEAFGWVAIAAVASAMAAIILFKAFSGERRL